MKTILHLFFAITILAVGCHDSSKPHSIIGKWVMVTASATDTPNPIPIFQYAVREHEQTVKVFWCANPDDSNYYESELMQTLLQGDTLHFIDNINFSPAEAVKLFCVDTSNAIAIIPSDSLAFTIKFKRNNK